MILLWERHNIWSQFDVTPPWIILPYFTHFFMLFKYKVEVVFSSCTERFDLFIHTHTTTAKVPYGPLGRDESTKYTNIPYPRDPRQTGSSPTSSNWWRVMWLESGTARVQLLLAPSSLCDVRRPGMRRSPRAIKGSALSSMHQPSCHSCSGEEDADFFDTPVTI